MNLEYLLHRLTADVSQALGIINTPDGPRPLTWLELLDRQFTDTWANYVGLVNGLHAQWRQTWLR